MTVNSRVIRSFLTWSPDATDIPLMNGLRVQILPTLDDLPRARKNQYAAFIASDALLIVWDDDPSHVMARAEAIESELMELVWQTGTHKEAEGAGDEKMTPRVTEFEVDSESGQIIPEQRSTNLINTVLVSFTLLIILTLLGLGFRSVAVEIAVDHGYLRLAFLVLTPVQVFFTLVHHSIRLISRYADVFLVLFPSYRWLYRPVHWSCSADAGKFQIFLRQMLASTSESNSSSYHRAMSGIQRRPYIRHCANRPFYQTGDLDL